MVTSDVNEDVTMSDVNGDDTDTNNDEVDMSKAECEIEFVIENISDIKDTMLSKPSFARNLPWKLMAMPRNSQDKGNVRCLGVFLQANANSENMSWSCSAYAMLGIRSSTSTNFERKIQHMFYSKENDWGYSHFINWSELTDPEKGYINNDAITLTAHVVADAPHGFSWDSRKHTGYVGLKNQGATCYMNSLLQTLFFTNKLRKTVYMMPTDADDSSKSVPLALQRVFYELQYSDKLVGTKKLTKSFGWETLDVFMQHDVQELSRVLLDNIEIKMKGTCVEGAIPKLFEGKMLSYVNCKNVEFKSTRNELFYDIQVNIKGKKDIIESLQDYITFEPLDGDNKYDAGEHGLQDAEKGVIFISFPPVLHLQLMRFQYDPITDSNVKINDRFEFADVIDLDPFLKEKDAADPAIYILHAVLVHSGDNHGGHYVVYINPKGDGKWCKFDDDVVSKCTNKEAIDSNFGGCHGEDDALSKHSTNAYMLVYIRKSEIYNVLDQDVDIPEPLVDRLEEEKQMEAMRRREKNEAHLYMSIRIILEDEFCLHDLNDLFIPDSATYRNFKVKRSMMIRDFIILLSKELKYPLASCRLWNMSHRSNNTYRPTLLVRDLEGDNMLQELLEFEVNFVTLYLETLDIGSPLTALPVYDSEVEVLTFFKFYEPKYGLMTYVGHSYVRYKDTINGAILPLLCKMAKLSAGTNLLLYEEVKPGQTTPIEKEKYTIPMESAIVDFMDGDIIVFQKEEADYSCYNKPTPVEYYMEIYQNIEVVFSDKSVTNDNGILMNMNKRTSFSDMTKIVGERLNIDPHRLQFFKAYQQSYHTSPSTAIKCNYGGTLADIFICYKPKQAFRLYYEQVTIAVSELEQKKQVRCIWFSNKQKEIECIFYPKIAGTVADLLYEAHKNVDIEEGGTGELRFIEIMSHKISHIHHATAMLDIAVSQAMPNRTFRIEEIPLDQMDINDDQALVPVAHYQKEIFVTFGSPFLIKLTDGQLYSDVMIAIRSMIDAPVREFEKYKLAIVISSRDTFVDLDNQIVNIADFHRDRLSSSGPWLGLEHINKQSKRRYNTEKPIKIHN